MINCTNTIEILDTRLCLENRSAKVEKYHGSGMVVLIMAIKPKKIARSVQDDRIERANLIIEVCEYCKMNILESNMVSHHELLGCIYSFGYQGVFKQVRDSSVGLYSTRQRIKDDRQMDVDNVAGTVESMIESEMIPASRSVKKSIAHADRLISPLLDMANELQTYHGDIFLSKPKNVLQCGIPMFVLMHPLDNIILIMNVRIQ